MKKKTAFRMLNNFFASKFPQRISRSYVFTCFLVLSSSMYAFVDESIVSGAVIGTVVPLWSIVLPPITMVPFGAFPFSTFVSEIQLKKRSPSEVIRTL